MNTLLLGIAFATLGLVAASPLGDPIFQLPVPGSELLTFRHAKQIPETEQDAKDVTLEVKLKTVQKLIADLGQNLQPQVGQLPDLKAAQNLNLRASEIIKAILRTGEKSTEVSANIVGHSSDSLLVPKLKPSVQDDDQDGPIATAQVPPTTQTDPKVPPVDITLLSRQDFNPLERSSDLLPSFNQNLQVDQDAKNNLPLQPILKTIKSILKPIEPIPPILKSIQSIPQAIQPIPTPIDPIQQILKPIQPILKPIESILQPIEPIQQILKPIQPISQAIRPILTPIEPILRQVVPNVEFPASGLHFPEVPIVTNDIFKIASLIKLDLFDQPNRPPQSTLRPLPEVTTLTNFLPSACMASLCGKK